MSPSADDDLRECQQRMERCLEAFDEKRALSVRQAYQIDRLNLKLEELQALCDRRAITITTQLEMIEDG